jgi:hypothetical protein
VTEIPNTAELEAIEPLERFRRELKELIRRCVIIEGNIARALEREESRAKA